MTCQIGQTWIEKIKEKLYTWSISEKPTIVNYSLWVNNKTSVPYFRIKVYYSDQSESWFKVCRFYMDELYDDMEIYQTTDLEKAKSKYTNLLNTLKIKNKLNWEILIF